MQDRVARELRRRVARLKRRRTGYWRSATLRLQITAWAAVQRERGKWWCQDVDDIIAIIASSDKT